MNEWINKNFLNVLKSLNIASKCQDFSAFEPVVPTKITFLTNFSVLKTFNDIIKEQLNFIARGGPEVNQWLPEKTAEKDLSCILFSANFHLDFNKFLSKTLDNGKNLRLLNEIEFHELEALINRLEKLSQVALESNITLNFDAEQTYLQTAIDTLVLDVQRKFNKNKPVVLNTYQCYLKTAGETIERHLQIASKERFCFGGKIVRGAYMNEERNLAKEERRADPINDNYEATTRMYERATELLLNEIKQKPEFPLRLIFATHNQDSIIDILTRMEEKGIEATKHGISFAQLIGMRDYITYTLGSKGIPVSKLVHYSNPTDGLAYLSRRLHENRSGLQNLEIEKKLPWVELKRRMFHPFKSTTPGFD